MQPVIIQEVAFVAVRKFWPRPHWLAQVVKTGEVLPQTYATRPAMWADLRYVAAILQERFAAQFNGKEP